MRFATAWRARLFWIFVGMAVLDTCGKTIAQSQTALDRVHDVATSMGIRAPRQTTRLSGNFDIFRYSSRHLFAGKDLYAEYAREYTDRYKYSPTFALLFAPLSVLPWPLAMLVWQLGNALLLFYALTRLLDNRAADVAIGAVTLEVWRSMQNAQSNSAVAATMVLAFVAIEARRYLVAAAWLVGGTVTKIFPAIGGAFALPSRDRWRMAAITIGVLVAALLLPAVVIGPSALLEQYRSWLTLEKSDHVAYMQSAMAMLHLLPGAPDIPNLAVELVGLAILLLPLLLRHRRWQEPQFRLNFLASVLLYVVLFNPQAERASYVIAFTGIAIWFATTPRTTLDETLFWAAFILVSVMSTLVPGGWVRTPAAVVVRLVLPCLAIWVRLQALLLARERGRGTGEWANY